MFRILMQNRIDALDKPGGDTEQMMQTKKYLEQMGVSVDISLDYHPDLSKYDIVHLFNTTRIHETYVQFLNAKSWGKPVVLSPIYHDYSEFNLYHAGKLRGFFYRNFSQNVAEFSKELIRGLLKYPRQLRIISYLLWPGYYEAQREVVKGVDCLLPQSHMDIEKEVANFGLDKQQLFYRKVVNGVNFEKFDNTAEADVYPHLKKDSFVLCVARIEPVKNQLKLVNSLKNTGIKLVLVGSINRYHKSYAKKVMKALKEIDGVYLGYVALSELINLYRKAKVHVLASYFETCGISNLEAAYAGCNIVSTNRGYAKEYFLDFAWYCDPTDEKSIRNAVLKAYESDKHDNLPSFIRENYTWEKAAKQTLEAYIEVMERFNKNSEKIQMPKDQVLAS